MSEDWAQNIIVYVLELPYYINAQHQHSSYDKVIALPEKLDLRRDEHIWIDSFESLNFDSPNHLKIFCVKK